jgi:hypothetical protein
MNIVKQLDQFNETNLYYCQPIKNNIIEDGVFIRILYKVNTFVLNGVYLLLPLKDVRIEKYFNKQKYIFDIHKNKYIVDKVKEIEESILKTANIRNKIPLHKISDNITHGNLKIINYNTMSTQQGQGNHIKNGFGYIDFREKDKDNKERDNNKEKDNMNTNHITETNNHITETNTDMYVILKISGIWENDTYYGVTFKCTKPMTEIEK